MRCACIDIGSNTTRLLVADCRDGALTEVLQQRDFNRLGQNLRREGRVAPEKVAEVAEATAAQAAVARRLGARTIRAVGTAALRRAGNRADIVRAIRAASDLEVEVLSGEEEARLAFVGATRTLVHAPVGPVGVVDVGGGSSELIVGTLSGGVSWSASFSVGSGDLSESYVRSDPPGAAELEAIRACVAGVFEGLAPPPVEHILAVGGSATSLRRLVGAVLEPETLARAVRLLGALPAAELARRFELDPRRVRLLPAGILVLEAAAEAFGRRSLLIARGGLREGILLGSASVADGAAA